MPRFYLQRIAHNYNPEVNRMAAAVECGSMAYLVAENPMRVTMGTPARAAVAALVWYMYERMLNQHPPPLSSIDQRM